MPIASQQQIPKSLTELIEPKHPNLREIKSPNEINGSNPFILTVAAPWCPHCQREIKEVLNPLCKTKDFRKKGSECYVVNGDSAHGQQFLQSIGLPVKGFPTTVMCKPSENGEIRCTQPIEGALPRNHFESIAKKVGLL